MQTSWLAIAPWSSRTRTGREAQITIEPRVEQRAAVHLDAELGVALGRVLRARLEPEVRAVGVAPTMRNCVRASGARTRSGSSPSS